MEVPEALHQHVLYTIEQIELRERRIATSQAAIVVAQQELLLFRAEKQKLVKVLKIVQETE